MAIQLDRVVPFGRSLDEYRAMFNLSEDDCCKKILGVGDGPASFNAEMTQLGHQVVSLDPLYEFAGREIQRRFDEVVDDIIGQVKSSPEDWVWTFHQSPEELRCARVRAFQSFLADFDRGTYQGRYVLGELPALSKLHDDQFDLGLCSHFLFLYSELFDFEFHRSAVCEMLRVAREVRIFPLLTLNLAPSPHVPRLVEWLGNQGYVVVIQRVGYELQRGGNEMLWVRRG